MNNSQHNILSVADEGSLLLLRKIAPLESLLTIATESDLAAIEGFTSASRQAERLAWRIMVRESLGREINIEYTENGIPKIIDPLYKHISVSHCSDMVMVVLSQRKCGVDIERLDRPFEKLATRYLSHEEQNFATQNIERAAIWCAKETLYKLANEKGLDLRADIQISALDLGEGRITGRIKDGKPIIMHIMQPDKEHIAVYHI